MDNSQNATGGRIPQLRQPSKIPSPGPGLLEMSASAENARASNLMPPPDRGLKHRGSALPEPASKRKTPAERPSGMARPPSTVPSSSRPPSAMGRGGAASGARHQSSHSMSSFATPRTSASGSLPTTTTSRPPSAQSSYRPPSAMSQLSSITQSSNATTTGTINAPDSNAAAMNGKAAIGKRKGTTTFSLSTPPNHVSSSSSSSNFQIREDGPVRSVGHGLYGLHFDHIDTNDRSSSTMIIPDRRNTSLTTAMRKLHIMSVDDDDRRSTSPPQADSFRCSTPSLIPQPSPHRFHVSPIPFVTPSRVVKRSVATHATHATASPQKLPFLTRDSHTKAWDTKGRLEDIECLYSELKERMNGTVRERNGLEEAVDLYKSRITELEASRSQLMTSNASMQTELESTKARLSSTTATLDDERRNRRFETDDLQRLHRQALDMVQQEARTNESRLRGIHEDELNETKRRSKAQLDEERSERLKEIQTLTSQAALELQRVEIERDSKEREARNLKRELEQTEAYLAQERHLTQSLREKLAESASQTLRLEASLRSVHSHVEQLELDIQKQSQHITQIEQGLENAHEEVTSAKEKLRNEESLRRKLHNQVQELKGNIRVFCRVRPSLETEPIEDSARIIFPDNDLEHKEIEIHGPEEKSSLGNTIIKRNAFSFDRVFSPIHKNDEVFEEISQLVQSALDGYNVCIFCYGQTGSGKTYTMSSNDGMIPRTVHQIYGTTQSLREKGWEYRMEGSFVEVYNECLNDLLGRPEEFDNKKKHEIRHDVAKHKTYVSDLTIEVLDSPEKVEGILKRASMNRSVAATKANERSSRSHSVFILRLSGENTMTGEKSEGTLNLVDLAGSERLSQSGSTGERLRETQNINRSLSCLGDVIGALGQSNGGGKDGGGAGGGGTGGHVPYRNSKLTYLLQYSLGGNSKTLMFVMISPLQAHLSETLTSLKFATKVHNTHIGTARRQTRIKDGGSGSGGGTSASGLSTSISTSSLSTT
ncbi:MAG: hypothetical protein M1823_005114 [Watsoniomyces obsoletus]|nr:MAG: hypothetical protein M1823_005114 [Watsoniomyces obsoletus]